MFKIDYYISEDEIKRLKTIQYEENINVEIQGQIELICNDKSIGIIVKELDLDTELLEWWFELLSKVVVKLQNNNNVFMIIPESAGMWLEFEKNKENVIIRKIKSTENIKDSVTTNEIPKNEVFWEERLYKEEFIQEIVRKVKMFIEEIVNINITLLKSVEIRNILHYRNKFQ